MSKRVAFFAVSLMVVSFFALAQQTKKTSTDEIYERVSEGSEEFVSQTFSNDNVQQMVMQDMLVSCSNGLCTVYAVNNQGDEFKTEFNVGLGQATNTASSVGPYVGLSLSYTHKNCTQKILIPRSLYMAINNYFYHFLTEDGGTRKTFNPTDEAMMIMFSTIKADAKGCN